MEPDLFSLQGVKTVAPFSFTQNKVHCRSISVHHDITELIQLTLMIFDMFNNLQRLEPPLAGLL